MFGWRSGGEFVAGEFVHSESVIADLAAGNRRTVEGAVHGSLEAAQCSAEDHYARETCDPAADRGRQRDDPRDP